MPFSLSLYLQLALFLFPLYLSLFSPFLNFSRCFFTPFYSKFRWPIEKKNYLIRRQHKWNFSYLVVKPTYYHKNTFLSPFMHVILPYILNFIPWNRNSTEIQAVIRLIKFDCNVFIWSELKFCLFLIKRIKIAWLDINF